MSQMADISMSRKRPRADTIAVSRKRKRYGYSKYQMRYNPRPSSISSMKNVVPDRAIVRMVYGGIYNLALGINGGVQVFRGNSIHDPDFTGVGHQPLGHDQWANFYEYYRVLSSYIVVDFVSQDTADAILCAVVPSEESTIIDSGNPDTYIESTYSKHKYLSNRGGNDSCRIVSSISTERALGVHRVDSGFDEAAAFGGNPTAAASWYWHVYVGTRTGAATPNADITVKIVYMVECMKRKQLTAS